MDVPTTYVEAISSPQSEEWKKAMKEEVDALEENETFELQPLPENTFTAFRKATLESAESIVEIGLC